MNITNVSITQVISRSGVQSKVHIKDAQKVEKIVEELISAGPESLQVNLYSIKSSFGTQLTLQINFQSVFVQRLSQILTRPYHVIIPMENNVQRLMVNWKINLPNLNEILSEIFDVNVLFKQG